MFRERKRRVKKRASMCVSVEWCVNVYVLSDSNFIMENKSFRALLSMWWRNTTFQYSLLLLLSMYSIFILQNRKKECFPSCNRTTPNISICVRKFRPFSWWYTFKLDTTKTEEKKKYRRKCLHVVLCVFLCMIYMSYVVIVIHISKWISNTFPLKMSRNRSSSARWWYFYLFARLVSRLVLLLLCFVLLCYENEN